jgi:hypothetical protein
MSQVTGALTIADGAAANKTFSPMFVAPTGTQFAEKTAGLQAGYITLDFALSQPSSGRSTARCDFALKYPVIQTVNGVSSVASVGLAKGYFVIPDTFTLAQRKDMRAFVANAWDIAIVKALVEDLDPMY